MELEGQGWTIPKMTDARTETIRVTRCHSFCVIKPFQNVKPFAIHSSWVLRDDSCPGVLWKTPPSLQQRQMSLPCGCLTLSMLALP